MMDKAFWICVKIIQEMSKILGMTYEELNIWLFVIIHPLITLIFIVLFIKYKRLYNKKLNEL